MQQPLSPSIQPLLSLPPGRGAAAPRPARACIFCFFRPMPVVVGHNTVAPRPARAHLLLFSWPGPSSGVSSSSAAARRIGFGLGDNYATGLLNNVPTSLLDNVPTSLLDSVLPGIGHGVVDALAARGHGRFLALLRWRCCGFWWALFFFALRLRRLCSWAWLPGASPLHARWVGCSELRPSSSLTVPTSVRYYRHLWSLTAFSIILALISTAVGYVVWALQAYSESFSKHMLVLTTVVVSFITNPVRVVFTASKSL
jgi:hypothetical protein